MSKTIDVIVAGSGLAGLFAAWAAASRNCRVRVISEGMGCLAISGGAIDLLGYDSLGNRLDNPWDGLDSLSADHPYTLLGVENIKSALDELVEVTGKQGLALHSATDEKGAPSNFRIPTIMGTLKPTWLYQSPVDRETVQKAKRVLVVSVKGFRDCRPALIINQLRRYKNWADREYAPLVLPAPFKEHKRSLNALDLAHVADRPQGRDWLASTLKGIGKNYDLALLPPMLGAKASSGIRKIAEEALGCPYLEMLSVPPGVTGLRIRDALMKALEELGVEFYENAEIIRTELKNGCCTSLTSLSAGREIVHHARAVVVATGGIISGGVSLQPGKARESLFGLEIPVPENVDQWTEPEIFGRHLLTGLGVKVDGEMRPLDKSGSTVLQNVFFAGRTIGGYDYAAEKSGHGVAAATGWKAGCMAAATAGTQHGDHMEKASGADI